MSGQALGVEKASRSGRLFGDGEAAKVKITGSATSTNVDKNYDVEITALTGGSVTYKVSGSASTTVTVASNAAAAALGNGLTLSFASTSKGNFKVGDRFGVTYDKLALDVTTNAKAGTSLSDIDTAISRVSSELGNIGDSQKRLSIKQDNLSTSMSNYEAARSRIVDADFAKEQMQIVKMQILQQTGISSLAQANSAPQSVLSLL